MNRSILIAIIVLVLIITGIIIFLALTGEEKDYEGDKYDCSEDAYNCDDFATQSEAQEVFDFCDHEGAGDVHRLDNDGDGKVCEGLA